MHLAAGAGASGEVSVEWQKSWTGGGRRYSVGDKYEFAKEAAAGVVLAVLFSAMIMMVFTF